MLEHKTLETRIVGDFAQQTTKWILPILNPSDPLLLKREPENPHDPNAIAVFVAVTDEMQERVLQYTPGAEDCRGMRQLGYVPRTDNVLLLDATFVACVKSARNKTAISIAYQVGTP